MTPRPGKGQKTPQGGCRQRDNAEHKEYDGAPTLETGCLKTTPSTTDLKGNGNA